MQCIAAAWTPTLVTPSGTRGPASARELAPGAIVGGYLVSALLGIGGSAGVHAATELATGREVAIKVVRGGAQPEALAREAAVLAQLEHPGIVRFVDAGRDGDVAWLAMERVHGTTLRAWSRVSTLRWQDAVRLLADVGGAIAAVHDAGIAHGDIKPENVMIAHGGRTRLLDFGLARRVLEPATSSVEGRLGTPAYLAPEQYAGASPDARSDQFAFCVMAWEILLGERPFAGSSAAALACAIGEGIVRPPPSARRMPARLLRALERGLRVDPKRRWCTMHVLLDELTRARIGSVEPVAVAAGW